MNHNVDVALNPAPVSLAAAEPRAAVPRPYPYRGAWETLLVDDLTGLPNRQHLHQQGDDLLRSLPFPVQSLALLLIGLERFSLVSSAYGYDTGNELLLQVATRLRHSLTPYAILARTGEDEFAILLPQSDSAAAIEIARYVLNQFTHPFYLGGQPMYLHSSIGVSASTGASTPTSTLLTQATIALHEARITSRNIALYNPVLRLALQERLALERDLRLALKRDELTLYYQPIVNLQTNQAAALETLVRWRHPKRGLLLPSTFLPLAADTGSLHNLDHWVLRHALAQAGQWAGPTCSPALAVNLSAPALHDPKLPTYVADALVSFGVPASSLIIEVTEDVVLSDPTLVQRVLHELHALGVRIALDDFGTGYASLSRLQQMPVDILKIDRTFTAGIGQDTRDEVVLRTLLRLGRELNLTVIVEGVETPAHLDWLQSAGCLLAQGYLFSKPVPPPAIHPVLTEHSRGCSNQEANSLRGQPDPGTEYSRPTS